MIHPDQRPILTKLDEWGAKLDTYCNDYADARRRSAVIKHDAELAYSRALLKASGSNAETRKAEAYDATEAHQLEVAKIDAELDALKRLMSNAEYQMDRVRSWNSAATAAMRDTSGGRQS